MEWIILILLLSFIFTIYEAKIKGYFGEKYVANKLRGLSKDEFKIIHDVMLPTSYGTTQIDHIVVSIYGIFVLETKNYKGWITGGENSEKWTKNMYGKKYSFRNPIKQNYAHVKALEELLGIPQKSFIPIVVFSGSATIKVKTNKPVIYISKLYKVICSYKEVVFTPQQICMFEQKILEANIVDRTQRKEHVRQIKTRVSQDNKKVRRGMCPKCGGMLVKRKGKYGAFYGCSNYPKCRYTKQL